MITSQLKLKPVPLANFIFLESPKPGCQRKPFSQPPCLYKPYSTTKDRKPTAKQETQCVQYLVGTPAGPVTAEEQCVDETCLEAPVR